MKDELRDALIEFVGWLSVDEETAFYEKLGQERGVPDGWIEIVDRYIEDCIAVIEERKRHGKTADPIELPGGETL